MIKDLATRIYRRLDDYGDRTYSKWKIITLLIPLLGERILIRLVGFADSIMVSVVSESAVSAMAMATQFLTIFSEFLNAVGVAACIIETQYVGKGDGASAVKTCKQSFLVGWMLAIPVGAVLILFGRPLLGLIYSGADEATLELTFKALRVRALYLLAAPVSMSVTKLFVAQGNTKVTLVLNVVANILNCIGNYVFINFFGWGVEGAAFATVLSTVFVAVSGTVLAASKRNPLRLTFKGGFKPEKKSFFGIIRLGLPTGLEQNLSNLAKIFVTSLATQCGSAALNANSVAHEITSMFVTFACAVGSAMMIVVGHCKGAGRDDDVRHYTKWLTFTAGAFQLVSAVALFIFMDPLLAGYHLSAETADLVRDLCAPYLIAGIVFWTLSYTVPNAFRACGDVKFTMMISVLSLWVFRVGFAYLIFYLFSPTIYALWIASYIDWGFRSLANVIRLRSGKWLKQKVI